jgi:hypothetical protein
VNCPHCGRALVCAACGEAVYEAGRDPGGPARVDLTDAERAAQTFLVVAKEHGDLLDQLREVVGDLGWVKLIKDRRDDPTILPREGRQGTVHVDEELP